MKFKAPWLVVGFCALVLSGTTTPASASSTNDVPETKPIYTAQAPLIDGKLTDSVWKKATELELLHYTKRTPLEEPTKVKLLYDRENLYVGFICKESQMEKTISEISTLNGHVFTEDCVEIMLAPNQSASGNRYYHFAANMLGTRYTNNFGIVSDLPWKVKTSRQKDGWCAEIVIPLKTVLDPETNAACWRVNFYREQQPKGEYSSWAPTEGSFHTPALFGILTGLDFDGKFMGMTAHLVPLQGDTTGPAVFRLETATAPRELPSMIIPKPVKFELNDSEFPITQNTRIIITDNPTPGILQAASEINQELKELYGIELPILSENRSGSSEGKMDILLGVTGTVHRLDFLMKSTNLKVTPETPGPEGYILNTDDKTVLICGSDEAGTYYGVQSFKQLLRSKEDSSIYAIGSQIWDKPAFKVRAAFISIDKDSPTAHRKMIEKIFARYKYNNILIEAEHGVAWKSHSEITSKTALDPEEVTKLVKFAKRHYLTVTPLIQSMGHGAWMFRYGNNLDFAEDSTRPDVYCPLNPKAYDFLFDIMDEAIEVFDHPEYIHIGHDEHDNYNPFPVHPECKAVGDEQLYYMDTLHIYQHLKSKGIKCMMWTDELEGKSFHPYLNALPRDILMTTWNYRDLNEFRSVEFLQKKGFQVLGCTAHRPMNIVNFSKWAENQKALGMMFTTWAGYGDNRTVVEREFKQIMAYIIQADFAWNPNHRFPAENDKIGTLPYYPGQVLREIWYPESRKPFSRSGFAVNLASYANTPLVDSDKKPALAGYGVGNDFSALAAQAKNGNLPFMDNNHYQLSYAKGIPVGIMLKGPGSAKSFPDKVTHIKIDQYASELNFLHTLLHPTKKNLKIGLYRIHYDDGTFQEISLINFQNITAWTDWETYFYGDMAWIGELKSNESVMLRAYCWVNPYPSKKIQSIDFESVNGVSSPLLLAISGISPQ